MEGRPSRAEKWIGQLLVILLVGMVFYWVVEVRTGPMQVLERRACQNAYREARTAAETLAIDGQKTIGPQRPNAGAATCGALRKAGRL